jgi:hypothetical protein
VFSVRSVPKCYKRDDLWMQSSKIRGLNLAVVKLTPIPVTKLPLLHKIHKRGLICFAKPGLTEKLCVVQKEKFQ